jgi:T-complex protein 1 subunit alpha
VFHLPDLFCSMGLDLVRGIIRNNLEYGVIEPAMSKVKIIQVGPLSTL